jgi:hypothetical protein
MIMHPVNIQPIEKPRQCITNAPDGRRAISDLDPWCVDRAFRLMRPGYAQLNGDLEHIEGGQF